MTATEEGEVYVNTETPFQFAYHPEAKINWRNISSLVFDP